MPIPLVCPSCGKHADVPDDHQGQQVACPHCGLLVAVPGAAEPQGLPEQQRQELERFQAEQLRQRQLQIKIIKVGIATLLFLGLACAGVISLILSRTSGPQSVAEVTAGRGGAAPRTQDVTNTQPQGRNTGPAPRPTEPARTEIVREHRAALKNESAPARAQAASALGLLGADAVAAVPDLTVAAGDRDVQVRVAAITALGRIGPGASDAVSTLVGSLLDDSAQVQQAAVDSLAALALPARVDIPVLKAAAESPNRRVRLYVMEVLGKVPCDGQNVIPVVAAAARDKDKAVRLAALQTWGKLGPQDRQTTLAGLLRLLKESSDPEESKACAAALAGLEPLTAAQVPALEAALGEKAPAVRLYAANALGKIGADAGSAVLPLRQTLKDDDAAVRRAVIQTLGNLGPAAAAARPDLLATLKGKEQRAAAADALLRIGPDAALAPAWIGLLKDEDEEVVRIAVKAIGQLEKLRKDSVPALIDALQSNKAVVRDCAASALGNMGPDAGLAVTDLVKALQDRDIDVQKSAVTALGQIGPDARLAVPQLIGALKVKNLHDAAFEALVKLGKEAVPALVQALKADDLKHPQRLDALGVLKEIGPDARDAVKVLVGITKSFDELPSVRKAAKAALEKIEAK
jgi:HEAT repeat protein